MHWQEELILGGRVKNSQDALLRCVCVFLWVYLYIVFLLYD